MKTLLLTLISIVALNSYAQLTYVPDDAFESYLQTTFPSCDNGGMDNYVITSAVNSALAFGPSGIFAFGAPSFNVFDFTGIEDFTELRGVSFYNLMAPNIDLSMMNLNNVNVINGYWPGQYNGVQIYIENCPLVENIIMPHGNLYGCRINGNLYSLQNVEFHPSNYVVLALIIQTNAQNLNLIDLSLTSGYAINSQLMFGGTFDCLLLNNGQCINLLGLTVYNTNTACIQVDDPVYSAAVYPSIEWQQAGIFSAQCSGCSVGIEELSNTPKQLLKIVDLMGRETEYKPNTVLIYVFDDGSTEKVFKMEE